MSDNIFTTGSGGDDGIGCGGKRKRTEGTKDSSDEEVDADTLLEREKERLRAAELESVLAQQKVDDIRKNAENIRQHIRSIGCYEADSLLRLSDGGDNHILHHTMSYLDIEDIGPCAIVCRTLNNQTMKSKCWEAFEAKLLIHDSLRSPSAQSCQQRVVRYHTASTLARQIGAIGDNLSRHVVTYDEDEGDRYMRVEDHCLGCSLPDLDLDVFLEPGVLSDDYELFVRLSRTSDNKLLAEGFTSFEADRGFDDFDDLDKNGLLSLDGLDLSNLSELRSVLQEISRLAVLHGDPEDHHVNPLRECMINLTAIVVAVNKSTAKACLVAAQNDFGGGDPPKESPSYGKYGLFVLTGNYEGNDEVHCCPRGNLSCCSHGRVALDQLIRLGMVFDIVHDPVEECKWFLKCRYDDYLS